MHEVTGTTISLETVVPADPFPYRGTPPEGVMVRMVPMTSEPWDGMRRVPFRTNGQRGVRVVDIIDGRSAVDGAHIRDFADWGYSQCRLKILVSL